MSGHVLTGWTAKRVGAAITIDGKDSAGFPVKLTNVAEIKSADPHPFATGTIRNVGEVTVTLRP